MSNYRYSTGAKRPDEGAKEPGANKPEGESARHMGWTSQRVKELEGESARGWTSHGANEPGGKRARGRTSQGANRQRGKKARHPAD